MYRQFQDQTFSNDTYSRNTALLDMKQGDVTGDGIIDKVYSLGTKFIRLTNVEM